MIFTQILSVLATQLNAAVFIVLVILVGMFFLFYKFGGFVSKWTDRDNAIKDLQKKWDKSIPHLQTRMDLIFQKVYSDTVTKSESPVQLTEVGKDVSEALKAEDFIEKNKEVLVKLVDKEHPTSAYDLQKACFLVIEEHLVNLLDASGMKIAKDKSFQYSLPLDHTLEVFAVLLRNRLMKESGYKYGLESTDSNILSSS